MLPISEIIIQLDFEDVIRGFQDLRHMGEMRQRWLEIKRLSPTLAI